MSEAQSGVAAILICVIIALLWPVEYDPAVLLKIWLDKRNKS